MGKCNLNKSHNTSFELSFIKKIGLHSTGRIMPNRREMLTRYIKSLELRANWYGLDKEAILQAAQSELQLCM